MNMPLIEDRPYHENSTEEEIAALRARVRRVSPNIVFIDEIPQPTAFSMHIFGAQARELGKPCGRYGVVVDVSNSRRPPSSALRVARNELASLRESGMVHLGVCFGTNVIMQAVLRFVARRVVSHVSVESREEDAISAVQHALG